ncbi:MAG: DUF5103 domain-containing protein [Bacteroidales bacterium]|jgi:hypothetical protein|nr:DUF5103 domain-containing protein [Bacteroidales bacterium]
MLRTFILSLLFLFSLSMFAQSAETYRTEGKIDGIHTLLIRHSEDWMRPPILIEGQEGKIEIGFDEFSLNYRDLYYEVIYCEADWTRSRLSSLDYMEGFNNIQLRSYATSFNTRRDYTHYSLTLPNEEISFKLSGNYVVRFYDHDTDEELVTACFSIAENQVSISGSVEFDTDAGFRKEYQQVAFAIHYPKYNINNPQAEVKVFVQQNRRADTEVSGFQPTFLQSNKLVYQHKKELIFEGCNEYRRFEMVTTHNTDMGVEKMEYVAPYYHIELQQPLTNRLQAGYVYNQDLNGRSFIRYDKADNNDVEADYFVAHFRLPMQQVAGGEMYVSGEFTNNRLSEFNKMAYNELLQQYEAVIPMKQGVYDYQYLFVPNDATRGTTKYTEGNYYETENEYLIMVYHRPLGGRYDKLIGYSILQSNTK